MTDRPILEGRTAPLRRTSRTILQPPAAAAAAQGAGARRGAVRHRLARIRTAMAPDAATPDRVGGAA